MAESLARRVQNPWLRQLPRRGNIVRRLDLPNDYTPSVFPFDCLGEIERLTKKGRRGAMPEYQQCVEQIRALLTEAAEVDQEIGEETDLVEELGLESIDVMELIEHLEDEFDISFPLNDLANIRTLADLARELEKLTEQS
jgi:acyl carrier protein